MHYKCRQAEKEVPQFWQYCFRLNINNRNTFHKYFLMCCFSLGKNNCVKAVERHLLILQPLLCYEFNDRVQQLPLWLSFKVNFKGEKTDFHLFSQVKSFKMPICGNSPCNTDETDRCSFEKYCNIALNKSPCFVCPGFIISALCCTFYPDKYIIIKLYTAPSKNIGNIICFLSTLKTFVQTKNQNMNMRKMRITAFYFLIFTSRCVEQLGMFGSPLNLLYEQNYIKVK